MFKSGTCCKLILDENGKYKTIEYRCNPDEIIEELKLSLNAIQENYKRTEDELINVKSEKYKDEVIQKLKKEIENLKDELRYGFSITKEEHEKINAWKNDWFKRKRGGDKYMGAIGGGFTYKFHPTGIGTSGVVIAPDGEEFQFQELG